MAEQKKRSGTEIIQEQREKIVKKVIEDMKKDDLNWTTPFLENLSPHNPVTGNVYRGGNRLHLAFAALALGHNDPRWITFKQITDNGWHLKKGSKSAMVEYWKMIEHREEDETTGEEKITGKYPKLVGYWRVFNAEDVVGISPLDIPAHQEDRTAAVADRLIDSSRCPVEEKPAYSGVAGYIPSSDKIIIADRSRFTSDESFTRVLLHEMIHSTGHPNALNRENSGTYGSPEYAQEELVAELGSLFAAADLGIQNMELDDDFYQNHVAYLQSWLSALEDDPSYLFKAAAMAEKADTCVMDRYESCAQVQKEDIPVLQPSLSETSRLAKQASLQQQSSMITEDIPAVR